MRRRLLGFGIGIHRAAEISEIIQSPSLISFARASRSRAPSYFRFPGRSLANACSRL